MVNFSVEISYPRITLMRRALDHIFQGEFFVKHSSVALWISAPRILTESEVILLRKLNEYNTIERQNRTIAALSECDPDDAPMTERQHLRIRKPPASPSPELKTADVSHIPLINQTTQAAIFMEPGTRPGPTIPIFIESERVDVNEESGTVIRGLYSVLLEVGVTSEVFDVTARISWSTDESLVPNKEDAICAVKRLHKSTSPDRFWAEYNSLKRLNSMNHPHIVETISVFRSEENGAQYFNFLFPLAVGNLKRLFRGDYNDKLHLQRPAKDSLWGQYVGLSSAVAYLHDSISMAHRDIKPSNILIYEEPSKGGSLILKLTDFGLSVDLSQAQTWERGSKARRSAWLYDSPELRKASPSAGITGEMSGKIDLPSTRDLLANDVWKLGCVFTEMTAFLVYGGSSGVSKFRDYITTTEDKVSSAMINDTRFDDGEKVKPQVLRWTGQMASQSERASRLQPILDKMLARAAERPTIAWVCEALVEANFPGISYDDGLRLAKFTPAHECIPLSRTETWQLKIEKWLGRQIDWTPVPRPRPDLRADEIMMTWEWQGHELFMSLSREELNRYKPLCLPRITNNIPLLPVATQPGNPPQHGATNTSLNTTGQLGNTTSRSSLGTMALASGAAHSSTGLPSQGPTKDIYWCVERLYTEPTEVYLAPITNSESLNDDEELYRHVNSAIRSSRGQSLKGWILQWLSWKTCTEVQFVKFLVVWEDRDQVHPMQPELPPASAKDYNHSVPEPHEVQMRAAEVQMVFGLRNPAKGRGKKTMINMVPKKLNPPPFARKVKEPGWGLHAKMGFSWRRFRVCMIVCTVANAVFVALWLVYISHTDLQNAFVPATVTMGLLFGTLVVLQMP